MKVQLESQVFSLTIMDVFQVHLVVRPQQMVLQFQQVAAWYLVLLLMGLLFQQGKEL